MAEERELVEVLKRYVQLEDRAVDALAAELRRLPQDDDGRDISRKRILKKIELHAQADALVEETVARYRDDLYFVARRLAEDDLEAGVVTRAHVKLATAFLTKRRRRYTWGDGLLAVGGLLLGTVIPYALAVNAGSQPPNLLFIGAAVLGGICFGMGILDKARS